MAERAQDIESNVAFVRAEIARATDRAARDPRDVVLVAVTKTVQAAEVAVAAECGITDFGENRIQEAIGKVPRVNEMVLHPPKWHLIGHLQTNKIRPAIRLFNLIHSVDTIRLAEHLSAEAVRTGHHLSVLLQVNVAAERSKYGFQVDELLDGATTITHLPALAIEGLMTIAPMNAQREAARPVFKALRLWRDRLRDCLGLALPHLSMGMSDDYQVAIEEGATIVRLGRAVFGPRL